MIYCGGLGTACIFDSLEGPDTAADTGDASRRASPNGIVGLAAAVAQDHHPPDEAADPTRLIGHRLYGRVLV